MQVLEADRIERKQMAEEKSRQSCRIQKNTQSACICEKRKSLELESYIY
jgi:hypothetical protein